MINHRYPSHIKNGVRNVKLPFDQEWLWNNIDAKLKKRRRRKFVVIFFFFGLVCGGTGLYFNSLLLPAAKMSGIKTAILDDYGKTTRSQSLNFVEILPDILDKVCKNDIQILDCTHVNPWNKNQSASPKFRELISEDNLHHEKVLPLLHKRKHESLISEIPGLKYSISFENLTPYVKSPHVFNTPSKKRKHFFSIYGGIGLVAKSFSDNRKTPEITQHVKQVQETEVSLEQKSAGFSFRKNIHKNFSCNLGLGYREVTERFHDLIIDRNRMEGFSQYNAFKVHTTRIIQYYANRFVDLELDFGYSFQRGTYQYTPTIGISNTLFSSVENIILTEGHDPLLVKKSNFIPGNVQLRFGLDISIPVSGIWVLNVRPLASFGLNSYKRPHDDIRQTYHVYSLQVGISKFL